MPFWDHLSLVSKETIFRRCTNFSDYFPFFRKSFLITIHKKKIRERFMNLFLLLLIGRLEVNISSFSRITLSSNFLGIIIRKCFSKVAKITEISASSENCFFGNKTQVISKGHEKTSEAYFIKWTTSGEPPVGLKSS